MNSGFQIPGRIQQQQQQQQEQEQHHNLIAAADENMSCTPVLLSMNQTQILQHIHNLPLTQQLFLEQQHFLPQQHHQHHQQQSRLHHHYVTAGSTGDSSAFFPVNFKLGLNEICSSNDNKVSNINHGEVTFLRGSYKQYEEEDPGTRHSSLKLDNCWQNQQDSAIKQTPFWEPLIGEAYENSESVHERQEMKEKEDVTNCLESKSRQIYGELEAIYKRLGTDQEYCNPSEIFPVNAHLSTGLNDHGSDAEPMKHSKRKRMKKKIMKKKMNPYNEIINPMTKFFENLVKRVMDHQENLHNKFNEVIERLDEERRERDEAWRNQELAHFQQEAEGRAKEKALAAKREATIFSFLEKISGQRINLPSFDHPTELTSTNTTDD